MTLTRTIEREDCGTCGRSFTPGSTVVCTGFGGHVPCAVVLATYVAVDALLSERVREAVADHLDDLLTMLGVDPAERQVEDVHGVDTPMGEDVKTVLARAALSAVVDAVTGGEDRG